MKITAIVAVDKNGAMGVENRLLCHLPDDLKFFKERTLGKTVIMGRRTFESIGKPLPNRYNIILTRQSTYEVDNCLIKHSIPECIDTLETLRGKDEEVFIIGGASIFEQTLAKWDKIILTVIDHEFTEADAFFPNFEAIYNNNSKGGGWNSKKLLLNHTIDERHKYSYSVYEICRDRRYTSKQSQIRQFQFI
ncbi:dihydrofolate reductase [Spirosoma radiotolerans]|uniref:dihydrofolate reductase n=1 Tax=Spirosoma radiotolerans TaxID=1379870 RepID=UPI00061D3606|nr:dihydrofolate reductase [Spirosoma radiotolerans]